MSAARMAAGAIFAKAPIAGRVKTRLVPPLTPEGAAAAARACIEETLARFPRVAGVAWTLFLDGDADPALAALSAARGVPIRPQSKGDLGERLDAAFAELRAGGFERVLAVGSDSPTLPLERLEIALARLEGHDAVVGPSEDGGYYLLGLSRPVPGMLRDIPWSTDAVVRVTLERAAAAGASVALLEPWYDVDDARSLARARGEAEPGGAFSRLREALV